MAAARHGILLGIRFVSIIQHSIQVTSYVQMFFIYFAVSLQSVQPCILKWDLEMTANLINF